MNKIQNRILELKQAINSVGMSAPMDYIKLDFIEKMDEEKNNNSVFNQCLVEIDKFIDKVSKHKENKNTEYYNALMEMKNIYSEAYIFSKLKSLLAIEKINEEGKKHKKTPDYKVKFRGKDIYIELKSLNMIDGTEKQKAIMNDSINAKRIAEEQIKSGLKVGMGIHVVQPYYSPNKPYDPTSVRLVIESLVDKINQNIKSGQYDSGDTILLIDFSDQLLLTSTPSEALKEKHDGISGELWHVAFGKVETNILKHPEFDGASNDDGILQKEGILITHPYIKGIIFHIDDNFYSIAEIKQETLNVVNLLQYLTPKENIYLKSTKI